MISGLMLLGLLASLNGNFLFGSYESNQEDLSRCYIDYEQSLHAGFNEREFRRKIDKKPQKVYLPRTKNLYERNNFLTKLGQPVLTQQIPKIIHQIWLGSPLPERYKRYQETWRINHPDWEYRLWTDEDLKNFNLVNQKAYNQATNYGEKSNIFRYEILYRYGGLYVDTDFECVQPFDLIHDYYEFYAGMAPANRITLINNGLIGSVPGHPILRACIEQVNRRWFGHGQFGRNGTIFFGNMIMEWCLRNAEFDLGTIFIAPPPYFYPLQSTVCHGTFAMHHWDTSWKYPVKD